VGFVAAMSKKKKKKQTSTRGDDVDKNLISLERDQKIIARVYEIGDPLCRADGIELVCVEYQREPRGRVLRLYLDKPGGVTLDDCASISRQIGDILDVTLDEAGAYNLEVSSPGPNRPIGKKKDFIKYRGNVVDIRTAQPFSGRKKFKGILEGMTGDSIHLRINDTALAIPYALVTRARLVNYTEKTDVNN
jgi:ribosome maturation factor RimP